MVPIIEKYSFNSGPKFSKPNCGQPYPYSFASNKKAINLSGPQNLVDTLFQEINDISNEFDQLIKNINKLGDNWNKCITIDGQGQDYVMKDDLNEDFKSINESFNNKEKINSILRDYEEITEDINEYIDRIERNYEEYQRLQRQKAIFNNRLHKCKEDEKAYYQDRIFDINKKMENYQDIGNIEDFGEWVI